MYNYKTDSVPKRGEIYYIIDDPEHPPIGGEIWPNRCGLIVSVNALNIYSHAVEVVYLTTSRNKKESPTHVTIISGTKSATAMCEQIHTVDISRLNTYIGKVTEREINDINRALVCGLGINPNTSPNGIFKKWEQYIITYGLTNNTVEEQLQTKIEQLKTKIEQLTDERNSLKALCTAKDRILQNIHELTA